MNPPGSQRRRRPNRRLRRRTRRPTYQHYNEIFSFSLAVGSSQSLTIANSLSSLPPNRAFKILWIKAEVCASTPAVTALSVTISEATQYLNTSRTSVLGPNRVTVTVRSPPSADFVYHPSTDTWQYGLLEAVCLHSSSTSAFVSGIVTVKIRFQPEFLSPTCPTIHLENGFRPPPEVDDAHSSHSEYIDIANEVRGLSIS